MSPEKLTRMANEIARFFASKPEEKAIAGTADHLRRFWDPRMRRQILAHLEAGGAGLEPIARAALLRLRETDSVAAC
ncbi:MAG: formate dehydrogenase subunit delta [Rhodospirillales bacterium]|nr:formate dehydrogenase subunit delta [Rhodospirillales bacterium]